MAGKGFGAVDFLTLEGNEITKCAYSRKHPWRVYRLS